MSSADRSQVSVARLRQLAQDALIKLGVPQKDAAVTADVLVDAELSGVESHGLMRLPVYAKRLADGAIDPRPDIRSTVNGATALMDGGNGLGPVVAGRAADLCSQLAGQYGVAWSLSDGPTTSAPPPITAAAWRNGAASGSVPPWPGPPWPPSEVWTCCWAPTPSPSPFPAAS